MSADEVQLRMSKKIAQLTKVIYMLNTKNDEHQYELKGLEESYESEVQDILKSAYEKVTKFQSMLEQKSQENISDLKKTIEALKAKNEKQQQEYDGKIMEYQQASEKLTKSTKEKVITLRREVEQMKKAFMSKSGMESKSLKTVQDSHKKEVADLVQTSNQKYRTMLNERLNVEDTLKNKLKDLQFQLSQVKTGKQRLKEEMEKIQEALNKQEKGLKSENAEQLKKLMSRIQQLKAKNHDLEVQVEKTRDDWLEVKTDLEQKTANLENSKAESEKIKAEKLRLELESKELKEKLVRTINGLKEAKSSSISLEGELGDEIRRLRALGKDHEGVKESLTKENQRLKESLHGINEALMKQVREMEAQRNQARRQTTRVIKENDEKKEKMVQEIMNLRRMHEKLNEERNVLQNRYDEAESDIRKLSASISLLEKQEKISSEDARNRSEEATKTITSLEAEVRRLEDQSETRLKDGEREKLLKEQAEMAIIEMKKDHLEKDMANEAAVTELRNRLEESKESVKGLQNNLEELKNNFGSAAEKIEILEKENCNLKLIQKNLTNHLEDALRRLKISQDTNETSLKAATSGVVTLENKLEAMTLKNLTLESHLEEQGKVLTATRGALYKLQLDHKTALASHKDEILNIKESTGRKIEAMRIECDVEVERIKKELNDLIRESAVSHGSKVRDLQMQLSAAFQRYSLNMKKAKGELQVTKMKGLEEIKRLQDQHRNEIKEVSASHERALANLKRDHNNILKKEIKELGDKHSLELSSRDRKHRSTIAKVKDNNQRALEDLEEKHKRNLLNESAEAQKDKRAELEALKSNLEKTYELELKAKQNAWRLEKERIYSKLDRKRIEFEELLKKYQKNEGFRVEQEGMLKQKAIEIADLHTLINAKEDLVKQTQREWQILCEKQRKELEEDHKQDKRKHKQAHLDEISELTQQYERAKAIYEEHLSKHKEDYLTMRKRYESRESREEDLEHIKALQKFAAEQASLRKQAVEELKYFKLELLNREENFNKKFSRQPAVGVLKTGASLKTVNRRKKPSLNDLKAGMLAGLPPLPSGSKDHTGQANLRLSRSFALNRTTSNFRRTLGD
ncbi:hypothetical protein AAMO2058_000611500 [Amorphochlora amoebiformis]